MQRCTHSLKMGCVDAGKGAKTGCMNAHMGMKMGARMHTEQRWGAKIHARMPQVQKTGHKDARWDAWVR